MADTTVEECTFSITWVGKCALPVVKDHRCTKHADLKCASCGKPATHDCSETMGLVCGAPLCNDCEHTIRKNGCNSGDDLPEGYKTHCKRGTQVYLPWYAQEDKK